MHPSIQQISCKTNVCQVNIIEHKYTPQNTCCLWSGLDQQQVFLLQLINEINKITEIIAFKF